MLSPNPTVGVHEVRDNFSTPVKTPSLLRSDIWGGVLLRSSLLVPHHGPYLVSIRVRTFSLLLLVCCLAQNLIKFSRDRAPNCKSMTSWRNGSASDSRWEFLKVIRSSRVGVNVLYCVTTNFPIFVFLYSHHAWTPLLPSEAYLDSTEPEKNSSSIWIRDECPARRRRRSFLDRQIPAGGFGRCSCMD